MPSLGFCLLIAIGIRRLAKVIAKVSQVNLRSCCEVCKQVLHSRHTGFSATSEYCYGYSCASSSSQNSPEESGEFATLITLALSKIEWNSERTLEVGDEHFSGVFMAEVHLFYGFCAIARQ